MRANRGRSVDCQSMKRSSSLSNRLTLGYLTDLRSRGRDVSLRRSSRAIAAEAEVERLRAALERIYREGDGWNEHRPEEGKYAGTTGEGHARCREIASAALEGKSDDK